jgi:hypothetical protein
MYALHSTQNEPRPECSDQDQTAALLASVRVIHTLGPPGTNCEAAAHRWFRHHGREGHVVLHTTLEEGAEFVSRRLGEALLGCAVYPELHTLVFSNLDRFALVDTFIVPTYNMVLASRGGEWPSLVSTHPAPRGLVPKGLSIQLVTSNSQAAADCAAGLSDGCITTSVSAKEHGLKILQDHGPVPMVFTLHM